MVKSTNIFLGLLSLPVQGFIINPRSPRIVPLTRHGFQLAALSDENSSTTSIEDTPSSSSAKETKNRSLMDFLTKNQAMDMKNLNEIINSNLIICSIASLFCLLYHIDASIPHPGESTLQEIITRIPLEAWDSYESVLNELPIVTKAATSATVYTIGDVISQGTEGVSIGKLDRGRVLRSLLAGFIGHGPLSHYWYSFLDGIFNNVLYITEWWAFVPKVLIDQSSWGPFWNNTYILLLGLMRLDSFENIWGDMKRTTVPLVVKGLKLWIPAHCITYGLISMENRLLWVDVVEIVWVSILATQAASATVNREAESDRI